MTVSKPGFAVRRQAAVAVVATVSLRIAAITFVRQAINAAAPAVARRPHTAVVIAAIVAQQVRTAVAMAMAVVLMAGAAEVFLAGTFAARFKRSPHSTIERGWMGRRRKDL